MDLQEIFCRQNPGGRAYHNLVLFQESIYAIGGKMSSGQFYADAWYRGRL
jgi:hypothetical protein